jgi:hypothetical protein
MPLEVCLLGPAGMILDQVRRSRPGELVREMKAMA